ncbi:hypothetical protein C8Q75DRAFT_511073 [Abortiporus biennis]|nr:hypothetical protein C8Q75DRAFT_511073 [Abortiporus biennis]
MSAFDNDNEQSGYDQTMSQNAQTDMGGGVGAHGSGVAGGYEGSTQSGQTQTGTQTTQSTQPQQTGTGAEKQDWLDKGITGVGKKLGFNVSEKDADKYGDMANAQINKKEGRGLPGVQ